MAEEKIFEILTKMYSEINNRFDKMDRQFTEIRSDVQKLGAKIDGEITPKLNALFDGYTQNTEAINRIETKLDELSEKVDRHDIKKEAIEGGMKRAK